VHQPTFTFLQILAPVVTSVWDECLHCTVAGSGNLAKAAGISTDTFPRSQHEDILDNLYETATTPELFQKAVQTTGLHLYWLFNQVYLISPTPEYDIHHAIQRMACRVEWGELWKISRCDEPALKSYPEALAFLQSRLPSHPGWEKSALYPHFVNPC